MKLPPFFAGKEIPREYLKEYFFNRKKELAELERKLTTKLPINIALYGRRRIGKTSLMEKIALDIAGKTFPIFIKCEKLLPFNELAFAQNLIQVLLEEYSKLEKLAKIKEKFKQIKLKKIGFDLNDYKFWLELGRREVSVKEALDKAFELIDKIGSKSNVKVVVFLDEFQELFRFGMQFLWALRAYIADSNASFLVSSSYHRFKEQLTNEEYPFFNFFELYELKPVPASEAKKYLETKIKKARMNFTKDVLVKIIEKSKCRPFYLQLLASSCYDIALEQNLRTIDSKIFQKGLELTIKNIPSRILATYLSLKGIKRDVFVSMCINDLKRPNQIAKKLNLKNSNVVINLKRLLEDTDLIEKDKDGNYLVVDDLLKEYVKNEFK